MSDLRNKWGLQYQCLMVAMIDGELRDRTLPELYTVEEAMKDVRLRPVIQRAGSGWHPENPARVLCSICRGFDVAETTRVTSQGYLFCAECQRRNPLSIFYQQPTYPNQTAERFQYDNSADVAFWGSEHHRRAEEIARRHPETPGIYNLFSPSQCSPESWENLRKDEEEPLPPVAPTPEECAEVEGAFFSLMADTNSQNDGTLATSPPPSMFKKIRDRDWVDGDLVAKRMGPSFTASDHKLVTRMLNIDPFFGDNEANCAFMNNMLRCQMRYDAAVGQVSASKL